MTEDTLESLQADLGKPQDAPGGAGRSGKAMGSLGFPAYAMTSATLPQIRVNECKTCHLDEAN